MKEASWNDCLHSNLSVKITPDKGRAKSLIETAENRIKFSNKELNENTANYIFEDYYSSILEIVHAFVILKGYKVDNHICLGFFIRDVLNREDLFRIFDDCRFKRNSLVYYGKRMNFETAKGAIERAKKLINEFKKILKNETM
ncbi:MAG: hypothetical protein AABX77_02495 [Nanoarchaeota archaeon]